MNRLPESPDGRLAPALFLDFDGTLAPIARRPDEVRTDPRLPATLGRLHRLLDGALAVVSGRPLTEIDAYLSPLTLPGAGAHGVERRDRNGQVRVRAGTPPAYAVQRLSDLASQHEGLRVELKPASLALHYREAPGFEDLCLAAARAAIAREPNWVVQRGKCVVELRPRDVTKGRTIEWFMGSAPFAGRLPVFVGDDDADEDGFAVVQAAGGWGVKVGPGATVARLRLDAPGEVLRWLERLAGRLELAAGTATAERPGR
jgi:trehalose 6-phosphate phosphatase